MVHGFAYPDGAARPEGRDTGEAITGIDLEFIWKNTSAQTLEGCQCNIPRDPEPIISSSLEHPQLSERRPPLIQRASGLKGGHQRDVRACREGNEVRDKGPFAICEENVTFS